MIDSITPVVVAGAAIAISPHFSPSPSVAAAVTFVGAALLSVLGVALGARHPTGGRRAAVVVAASSAVLLAIAIAHVRTPWIAALVDALLIAVAVAIGGSIGEKVEHPSHLLPAAAVASAADIVSVVSSWGPSAKIAASERALSVLAISFPVPGTHAVAPALGVGDLVFIALCLGVARRHDLPYRGIAALALLGILCAGFASAWLGHAVPALPAIGVMIVAFVPGARALRRRDRGVATIAIGVSLVVAALTVVRSLR